MVSHPETGSDSPIGSDRESGRDISPYAMFGYQKPFFLGLSFHLFHFSPYILLFLQIKLDIFLF